MLLQRDIIHFKKAKEPKRLSKRIGGPFAFLHDLRTQKVAKGTRARVVFAQGEHVILFRMSESSTKLWQADQDFLRQLESKGIIETEPYRSDGMKPQTQYTDVQIARRDEAWKLIEPLIRSAPRIYNKRFRVDAIRSQASKARVELIRSGKADRRKEKKGLAEGSAERRIQNLLRRYWCRGMTPDALIPDYEEVGGRGQRKNYRGSKEKRPVGEGRQVCRITPEIEGVFKKMTDRYYKGKDRVSLKFCSDQARGYLATAQLNKDAGLELRTGEEDWTDKVAVPSYRQFLYWYNNSGRSADDEKERLGPSGYDMAKRARFGSSLSRLFGVGSRFEIDATVLDVGCVSLIDRESYVGRPTLYLVIDVYSRMIVGMYLGFENASWHTFGIALRNVAEDKVKFCSRYGLDIEPEEWPVRDVMPARILADRGEGEGYKASDLVAKTGVIIENTAGYRGDMKGTVEKRFDIINNLLRPILPGAVAFDHMKRGDDDYRRKAKFNIDEVTRAVIRAILYYNNHHVLSGFKQPKEMVAAKIPAVPKAMWNWARSNGQSELKGFSLTELDFALLQTGHATPEKKGLRFQGMHYRSAELYEGGYAHKTGAANKQVVSWDLSNTSVIWRHRQDGSRERCELLEDYAAYKDLSFSEAHKLRLEQNSRKVKAEIASSVAFHELVEETRADLDDAEFENPQKLRASAISSAASNRKTELDIERMQEQLRRELRARNFDRAPGTTPAKDDRTNPLNATS
ncbi:DDE-type integrase/transposase/recombinase [Pelagerythrobacter aerophilus]|uniref:Integrase catalytic domain-containing protein n=1 Tax=Pelagerythrobacter aerophilus TaxID=2306995 RepID=A0A418NID4_9SPHN|nr:DDE-type integrase/transposase/recombinase [Pelagerythrobacter aerophilus]RIV78602.1 hypothetical protein D2V04_07295 [Pelagerythrobacter aerophilus]